MHLKFGCWSALFALAVQFMLLFGHLHRGELVAPSSAWSLSLAIAAQDPSAASDVPTAPLPSAPVKPVGLRFDYCAICVVIKLAGTIIPAAVPILTAPSTDGRLQYSAPIDVALVASPHLPFHARAPPLA
jgi:hypothetical protein